MKKVTDFDDMLEHCGSWGRFQFLLMVIFFPFNLFLGYVYLSSILINYTPPHWCKVDALMNSTLTLEERRHLSIPLDENQEYSKCMVYNPPWEQVLAEGTLEPSTDWPQVACIDGWEFDIDNFHRSIVTDFNWVCQEAWIPTFSQAFFFVGAIPGTLLFGYLSDTFGRIPALVSSNLLAMLGGLLTPFSTGMYSYIAIRCLTGLSYSMFFQIPYILAIEYVDKNKRTWIGNMGLAIFLTISGVYQPWLVKYLGDWKVFSWIIFSQIIFVVFVPLVMPESSRWLLSTGQTGRAVQIMRRIAKFNKKQVTEETFKQFEDLCRREKEELDRGDKLSVFNLFRERNTRKNSLWVMFLFLIIYIVFDATVRNVNNLKISIYYSFMVSVALELPADISAMIGLTYLGRRVSAIASLGLCAICILIVIPLNGHVLTSAAFALAGRFFSTYAMNTAFQLIAEILPTCLRGQGIALATVLAVGGQISSPYIVYSSVLHPDLPFYIIGLLGLIGMVPSYLLPETAGMSLPNTLEDAKNFGLNFNHLWMPMMSPELRYITQETTENGLKSSDNAAFQEDKAKQWSSNNASRSGFIDETKE